MTEKIEIMTKFYAAFVRDELRDQFTREVIKSYLFVKKRNAERWEIPIGNFREDSHLDRLLGVQSDLGLSCRLDMILTNQNYEGIPKETEVYILTHKGGELGLTEKYETHRWMTLAEFKMSQDLIHNYQKVRRIICIAESALFQSGVSGS